MKKLLVNCLFFGFLSFAMISAEPAGNWYNDSDQFVAAGSPVSFNNINYQDNISLLGDAQTILFANTGNYIVTFTGTGLPGTSSGLNPGPWSLGLALNDVLVPGSIAAASNGSFPNAAILEVFGQVILKAKKGDLLRLINTTTVSEALAASVSGNASIKNSSITMVIEALKIEKDPCGCR